MSTSISESYPLIDVSVSYLEMAMNGPLDGETRDNLVRSHAASKVGGSESKEVMEAYDIKIESPVYYQRSTRKFLAIRTLGLTLRFVSAGSYSSRKWKRDILQRAI